MIPKSAGEPAGWKLRKEKMQLRSECSVLEEFLLAQGKEDFVLIRPSTASVRPTHVMVIVLFQVH